MIVRDGEGASRFVALHIHGARNAAEAEAAARAIANSSLVKVSWCGWRPKLGTDPVARSVIRRQKSTNRLSISAMRSQGSREMLFAFRRGRPTNLALKTLAKVTSALNLNCMSIFTSDALLSLCGRAILQKTMLRLTRGDVNDPATLGG